MSWFDATGIASLAKNALKEAQKTIDKALDIKDDDLAAAAPVAGDLNRSSSVDKPSESAATKTMKQSQSHPDMPSSIWGSFTGSFFDNPNADETKTVTTAPSSSIGKIIEEPGDFPVENTLDDTQLQEKSAESSAGNSSASVEIVSPPTTPGSNLTSPDAGAQNISSYSTIQGSESIEILSTPTSELITVSSSASSEFDTNFILNSSTDFVVEDNVNVVGGGGGGGKEEDCEEEEEDEEDSKSYNTVTEGTANTIFEKNVAITTAPSRSSLHLSLDSSSSSTKANFQNQTSDNNGGSLTTSTELDKKVPSLLEEAMLEKSFENFDAQTHLSDSTQSFEDVHQTLIQEQLASEQRNIDGGNVSPSNSSDERSDIVKINSEQTSGHNSADEIETATSSDIEIISSPNGDSSSTNSCAYNKPSPLNNSVLQQQRIDHDLLHKKKGHCRESSGNSVQSTASDDSRLSTQSETERLMRRISELCETLESREFKLMELGRENAELHDRNIEMKCQLDSKRKRDDCLEVTTVTEEYTQRLSALEKKFQQSIRERDNLREQLKSTRSELFGKVSREELEQVQSDKNFMIGELKAEGEKLSKQILQHSNIIKKLRAKEKENDATLKRQKDQIEELTEETERLKKSLFAKDEVERSQIEAVHKLSSEKRKFEKENLQLKSQLDDISQKLKTVQTSFDVAKKEFSEKQHVHTELTKKAENIASLESEKNVAQTHNQQMIQELNNLREKLKLVESGNSSKEQKLRQENGDLLRRLAETEMKLEEQTHSLTESTIPLVRQLQALQSTLNARTLTWESQEKQFMEKLDESQSQLKKLTDIGQVSKEQFQHLNTKNQHLEERLSAAQLRAEQSISLAQQKELEFELRERDLQKELTELKFATKHAETQLTICQNRIDELQEQLADEKELVKCERRRRSQDTETKLKSALHQSTHDDGVDESSVAVNRYCREDNSSPTLSLGHASVADSLSSNLWPLEDIDCISNSGRPSIGGGGPSSLYGSNSFGNQSTSIIENLQASLKQRDGENHQLQWELSRLQTDRNFLMSEVTKLTNQLENINEKLALTETIEEQFKDLQCKYDALLQMYGEKVEETQELNLDLDEIKEIYRAQLDELLLQQKQLNKNPPN